MATVADRIKPSLIQRLRDWLERRRESRSILDLARMPWKKEDKEGQPSVWRCVSDPALTVSFDDAAAYYDGGCGYQLSRDGKTQASVWVDEHEMVDGNPAVMRLFYRVSSRWGTGST